jgi:hypothetical protein
MLLNQKVMLSRIKSYFKNDFINSRGWSSKRKIVVIESDDWGTIRSSSKEAVEELINRGFPLKQDPYSMLDCLESNTDLEALFEVLGSFKDIHDRPACLTANTIVCNPDFDKIKESGFQTYHYEVFTETLKKYPEHDKVYDLYLEGIKSNLFVPQFHGREHLHVNNWMHALDSGDENVHAAFNLKMATTFLKGQAKCRDQFLDGFGTYTEEDFKVVKESISDGLKIFEDLFGYKASSVISPCLIWHPKIEKDLNEHGIRFIQSGLKQNIPLRNEKKYKRKRHYFGETNQLGQVYTIRNVIFEPALQDSKTDLSPVMKSIEKAFLWRKPAIISSHRLNYIGSLDESNRKKNLDLLKRLLKSIQNKWPDVEFLSSDQLGVAISNSRNSNQSNFG